MRNDQVAGIGQDYQFQSLMNSAFDMTFRFGVSCPGNCHLKSWLVDTSADGEKWRDVDHKENNEQPNGTYFTSTFPVVGGVECRFIRLANISRNHFGDGVLRISAWEILGSVVGWRPSARRL
jgi:hypothetical protein